MQGRMFTYRDTQITRLGGTNWAQLPINRAHTATNDGARDGFHRWDMADGIEAGAPLGWELGVQVLRTYCGARSNCGSGTITRATHQRRDSTVLTETRRPAGG